MGEEAENIFFNESGWLNNISKSVCLRKNILNYPNILFLSNIKWNKWTIRNKNRNNNKRYDLYFR